jgi:multiple sugar transport system substrate-binding protein
MNKGRVFVIALVLLTMIGVGVLSAQGQAESAKKPILTVWMKKQFVEDQNVEFEKRVKEFAAEKNVDVVVELIAYEDFFPKWTAAIQSNVLPDLCFFGYQEVGQFYQQGLLMDVTDILKDVESKYGSIYESSKDAVTFDGRTYAFPVWGEGTALYYRKDLLSAAGYQEPPKTWAEFKEIAKAVTNPSKGIYGAGLGYGSGNSDAEFLTRSIMFAHGGSIFDANKNLDFDTPENRAAFEYIISLFEEGLTPPTAIGWNDGGNNSAYISGQVAMTFNTGSIVNALGSNPDLKAKTGLALLPAGPAGQYTVGIANNMGIFKNAKNKDLAVELMEYLYEPTWYATWIEAGAPLGLPVYEDLASSPIWDNEYYKPFMDSMKTFKYLGHKGDYTPNAGKIYNMRLINTMFESIIAANTPLDVAIKNFISEAKDLIE